MRTGAHHVFRIVGEDFSLFFYYNAKLIYDFQNLLKSTFIIPNEILFFVQNLLSIYLQYVILKKNLSRLGKYYLGGIFYKKSICKSKDQ